MDILRVYRRDMREKLETLGEVTSESDDKFSVLVNGTQDEAYRRVVQLIPSAADIKVSPHDEGVVQVDVQFAGVSTLNE